MTVLASPDLVSTAHTLDTMVDEVLSLLGASETWQVTTLVGALTDSATDFLVDSVGSISPGIIEIDHEVMLVSRVNPTSNQVTVGKRGYRGTAASPHASGALVFIAPPVTRGSVVREINGEIADLWSAGISSVATQQATVSSTNTVALPSGDPMVVDVKALVNGEWVRVRTWEVESGLPASESASGVVVVLPTLCSGDTVRVTIASRPPLFASVNDQFGATGLPATLRSLVVLGAACRLLPALDAYRLAFPTVGDGQQAQVGPASLLGRELRARYRERLAQEQSGFAKRNPSRIHFTR